MTLRSNSRGKDSDGETVISPTELRALRRLAEPEAPSTVEASELWASRYRIIEPIGRGGMGDVFLARDILLDRLVALKVLRNKFDDDLVDERLLLREARAGARAEHERIARVYDAGTWNDRAFIAMEYVRGETLRAWMKTQRATVDDVIFFVQQLLEGVRALHERGLVHRDLKPENVMVASDGNLRILDLGITRRVPLGTAEAGPSADRGSSASFGFGVGTPGYMAPEQWQALEVDARADLFALGAIFYELVTGIAPFKGPNNAVIRERTLHVEVSFSGAEWDAMPSALLEVTRTALQRDRDRRFERVELMIEPLLHLFRPSAVSISRAPVTPPLLPVEAHAGLIDSAQASALGVSIHALSGLRRNRARAKWFWAAAGVLVLSAVVGSAVRYRNARRALPPPARGMVRLVGGTFRMGTDADELAAMCKKYPKGCPPEAQNEVPKHTVTVGPFEIDEREVTNQEFADFLSGIAPSILVEQDADDHYDRFVRYAARSSEVFLLYDLWPGTAGITFSNAGQTRFHARQGFDQLPVTQVSWLGARLFCKNSGKRLPTEAEWEFAAAGLERRPFSWGSKEPDCNGVHIASKGWISTLNSDRCGNAQQVPFAVMSAAQDVTPDGVRDLAGNVGEWVDLDDRANRDDVAYGKRLASEDPEVVRGGAFDTSFMARATTRTFRLAFNIADDLGFRCAK